MSSSSNIVMVIRSRMRRVGSVDGGEYARNTCTWFQASASGRRDLCCSGILGSIYW